jgi:rubrerythrin
MHKGHTAGGPWGVMPHTVKYVLGVSKGLKNKYPDLAEKAKDVDKNHLYLTNAMNKNPEAAYDFAKTLYNHLDTVHDGDVHKIVHSWHHGIGGTHKASKKNIDHSKSEYNQRFNKFLSQLKSKKVEKALTAGYGGASAPTGRTHGAVFQAESLEGGRMPDVGFKYITCDHCGHEQVHTKHQVKCRKCDKAMSLEKLFRYMF